MGIRKLGSRQNLIANVSSYIKIPLILSKLLTSLKLNFLISSIYLWRLREQGMN